MVSIMLFWYYFRKVKMLGEKGYKPEAHFLNG
jgi:hypothetical protein